MTYQTASETLANKPSLRLRAKESKMKDGDKLIAQLNREIVLQTWLYLVPFTIQYGAAWRQATKN